MLTPNGLTTSTKVAKKPPPKQRRPAVEPKRIIKKDLPPVEITKSLTPEAPRAAAFKKPAQPKAGPTGGGADLSQVTKLVIPLFHAFTQRGNLEIEAKLGKWQPSKSNTALHTVNGGAVGGGHFESGVTYEKFMEIHAMLCTYPNWVGGLPTVWVSTFDYILDHQVRVTKTSQGNTFIKKTTLEHLTLKCPERPYDLRISLKEELPTIVQLPQVPQLVRVKKRKSFNYKNTWRFDLTIVWTGHDEQEAQSKPPTHEVECEYIGDPRAIDNVVYVSQSILEKMIDFLGRDKPLTLIKV
jgi:hypothetical protein